MPLLKTYPFTSTYIARRGLYWKRRPRKLTYTGCGGVQPPLQKRSFFLVFASATQGLRSPASGRGSSSGL